MKKASSITLEYDGNSDREDKYGRVLAFVYVDDKLLEEKLVEKGYAKVAYVYGDYAHVDDLLKKEEKAKNKKIGIWSEEIYPDVQEDKVIIEENTEDNFFDKIFDFIVSIVKKIIALF